jgi:hypothetical protein
MWKRAGACYVLLKLDALSSIGGRLSHNCGPLAEPNNTNWVVLDATGEDVSESVNA